MLIVPDVEPPPGVKQPETAPTPVRPFTACPAPQFEPAYAVWCPPESATGMADLTPKFVKSSTVVVPSVKTDDVPFTAAANPGIASERIAVAADPLCVAPSMSWEGFARATVEHVGHVTGDPGEPFPVIGDEVITVDVVRHVGHASGEAADPLPVIGAVTLTVEVVMKPSVLTKLIVPVVETDISRPPIRVKRLKKIVHELVVIFEAAVVVVIEKVNVGHWAPLMVVVVLPPLPPEHVPKV